MRWHVLREPTADRVASASTRDHSRLQGSAHPDDRISEASEKQSVEREVILNPMRS